MRSPSRALTALAVAVFALSAGGSVNAGGAVRGTVRTASGEPSVDAEVRLRLVAEKDSPDEAPADAANVRTDAEGRFEIATLPAGRYAARARHATHGFAASRPFDVGAENDVALPAMTLRPGATLVVSVTGDDGRPMAGAFVECVRLSSERPDEPDATDGYAWIEGGPDGVARVPGLAAGRHEFAAYHPRYLASAKETIELRDGMIVERAVRLEVGASLSGWVVDENGFGVAGAMVEAKSEGPPPWTRAGADGSFVLTGLPDREAAISASAEGFVDSPPVAAMPGAADLRLLVVRTGRRVEGRVIRAAGSPAEGPVRVTALRIPFDPDLDSGVPFGEPVAVRDEAFVFENLPPGLFRFFAESVENPDVCGDAGPIVCEPGAAAAEVVIELVSPRSLVVRVVDAATGSPIRGAYVAMSDVPRHDAARLEFTFDEFSAVEEPWITDESGRFTLGLLATAEAILVAHAEYVAAAVAVPDAAAGEAIVALERGGVLEGTARDAAGVPLAGQLVVPILSRSAFRAAPVGEDGRFRIAGLAPGAIEVGLAPEDTHPFVDVAEFATDVRSVAIEAGAVTRVDFGGAGSGVVRGIVSADGEPRAGFEVALLPLPYRAPLDPVRAGLRRTLSAADGSFSFTGLEPGRYSVWAGLDVGRARAEARVAGDGKETIVDLRAPEGEVRVRVTDSRTGLPIEGARVEASEVRGSFVTMSLVDENGYQYLDTPHDGAALFRLKPGTFLVEASAAGDGFSYVPARALVTVGERDVARLDFALEVGFWVEGVVRDENGHPVPDPVVLFYDATAPQPSGIGVSQGLRDGRFLMYGLKPGTYATIVTAEGFAPRHGVSVSVERGGVPGPVLTLGRGGSAVVRVVTRDDEPVRRARVDLHGPKGTGFSTRDPRWIDLVSVMDPIFHLETGDDGVLRIDLLEPGEYVFEVDLGAQSGRATAVVRDGESVDVSIVVR